MCVCACVPVCGGNAHALVCTPMCVPYLGCLGNVPNILNTLVINVCSSAAFVLHVQICPI